MSKLKIYFGIAAVSTVLVFSGAALAGQAAKSSSVDGYEAWKEMALSDSCMNADAS